MVGKVLMAIVAIILLFLFFGPVRTAVTDFRTDTFTEAEPGLETAAVSTGNFTLDLALYNDDITNVTSITSNITDDGTISPTGYTTATRNLQVTGLAQNENRTLTLVYRTDALEEETGLSTLAPWLLFFFVLACGGLIVRVVLIKRGR